MNRTVGKILIGLDALQHRQNFVPRPIGIALHCPRIEIGFDRPRDRHHIDRGAAAQDAPGKRIELTAVVVALGRIHEDVRAFEQHVGRLLGIQDRFWNRLRIGSRLEQQHFSLGLF